MAEQPQTGNAVSDGRLRLLWSPGVSQLLSISVTPETRWAVAWWVRDAR